MSDLNELKRLAEAAMPKCCGEAIPAGVEHGGQREMMCCDAWQSDGEVIVNPFDLLSLIQENERLRAANIDSVDWVNSAKADIERLDADNRSKNGSMKAFGEQISKLQRAVKNRDRQLDKLRADAEALRKDAERYWFLMRNAEEIYYIEPGTYMGWNLPVGDTEECGKEIDSHIKQEGKDA